MEIREKRLYREDGWDTFEEYCQERWGWNASRARQLMGAAEVARSVTTVTLPPPSNERQARELIRIPDPETRREIWQQAQEAFGEHVTALTETYHYCYNPHMKKVRRDLYWVGSTQDDLREFPDSVQDLVGRALLDAQYGDRHPDAKPLKGFGGASVIEIVDDFDGDTYRAVYTVRLRSGVYAVHAFQKKAKKGIKTPKRELDLIHARLREAARQDAERREEAESA